MLGKKKKKQKYIEEFPEINIDIENQFEMTTDLFGDGNASIIDIEELLNNEDPMYEDWDFELIEKNDELQLHAILKNDAESEDVLPSRYIDWIKINNCCFYIVIGNLVE